jgi:septum formation inhibitor-activating ATPase MinD
MNADVGLRNLSILLGLENRVMYTAMEVFENECWCVLIRSCIGNDSGLGAANGTDV